MGSRRQISCQCPEASIRLQGRSQCRRPVTHAVCHNTTQILCRVDGRRLALAHPALGPHVAALLGIPALEDTISEVLDALGATSDLESIQVNYGSR